jgi:hypothetical protein
MDHSWLVFIRAGEQVAFPVEIHAVGAAGLIQENAQLAVGAVFPDLVVGLVGEKHVALAVHSGPFGKAELFGHQLWFGARGQQAAGLFLAPGRRTGGPLQVRPQWR